MINDLISKAQSKEGVWLLARNLNMEAIFPDSPKDKRYQAMKISMKENNVDVYTIFDGLPILRRFSKGTAYFEEGIERPCFTTLGKPVMYSGHDDEEDCSKEDYKKTFFEKYDMTEDEFNEMEVKRGKDKLPVVDIKRLI